MSAESAQTNAGKWSPRFDNFHEGKSVRKARRLLSGFQDRPEDFTRIVSLEILLQRVAVYVQDDDAIPSSDLLAWALNVVDLAGGNAEFRSNTGIIRSASVLIERLHEAGYPTSDLLIALARYQSRLQIGSRERRASIERAVEVAGAVDERLRALIIRARFKIDTSDYRGALADLRLCERLLGASGQHSTYGRSALVTMGMAHFYTDHKKAASCFNRVIERAESEVDSGAERQAVSEALHYLGRIAHGDRRHQEAIDLYVRARAWSSKQLEWEGYHHLRVAEILAAHGTPAETEYHVDRARYVFTVGLQQTSGEAQLEVLCAHIMDRDNKREDAVQLLKTGIRKAKNDGFRRGGILFRVELAKLCLGTRRFWLSPILMLTACLMYLLEALRSGPRTLYAQLVTGAKFALSILTSPIRRRGARTPETVVHCPCGEHEIGRTAE